MIKLLFAIGIISSVASTYIGIQLLRIKYAKNPFYNESEPDKNKAPEEYSSGDSDIDDV